MAATLSNPHYYVAAVATILAGLLLLILFALDTRLNGTSVFFLVSGLFQIFWTVPILKRWKIWWYYAAIIGTIISIAVYVEYPIFVLGIGSEILQAVFIVFCGLIIWKNWSLSYRK